MIRGGRIEVRQIQDRDVTERLVGVLAHVTDAEPLEEGGRLDPGARGDPRERRVRRWPARARGTHHAAGQRVQEARLADARPSHEREHIRRSDEAKPGTCALEDTARSRRVEAERARGIRRIGERRKGGRERHETGTAIAARRSAARARSSAGAATRYSKRARSVANTSVSSASSRSRAPAIISAIAASPKIACSSFWLRNPVAATMPSSVPVRPAVWAKTPIIAAIASAFTPSETPNARLRLPAPREATSLAMLATQSRRRGSSRSGRSADDDQRD